LHLLQLLVGETPCLVAAARADGTLPPESEADQADNDEQYCDVKGGFRLRHVISSTGG